MAKGMTNLKGTVIFVLIGWLILGAITVGPWISLAVTPCYECASGWQTVLFTGVMLVVDFIALIGGFIAMSSAAFADQKAKSERETAAKQGNRGVDLPSKD